MKWNVIVRDITTGTIGPYNIFDCADFRIAVEKIIAQKYDKTRFLEELDREADYCFRAQIEWETFFHNLAALYWRRGDKQNYH